MKPPRQPLDQYETPPHYVKALLNVIGKPRGVVYEPCVGLWHIAEALLGKGMTLLTNDLDPKRKADTHLDAAYNPDAWGTLPIDWCITNPPFSRELPILENAVAWCKNVAFLARLSFLEPTIERAPFWRKHPPTGLIVLPRYSFRNNKAGKRQTDSVTCCWIVWREGGSPCLSSGAASDVLE